MILMIMTVDEPQNELHASLDRLTLISPVKYILKMSVGGRILSYICTGWSPANRWTNS